MPTSSHNKNAVTVENLTVQYGKTVIFPSISFSIPSGSITAVIGPNGSGKSTLIKAVLDLIPSSGSIEFQTNKPRLSYIPQHFTIREPFPMTVSEFLHLLPNKDHCPLRDGALKEVGLEDRVLSQQIHALSGGQWQRVLIAQALMTRPDILFLDEPASGIDVTGERKLYELLSHLRDHHGTTIMIVSHDISMVAKSVDHVLCVNRDLICHGPPQRVLTDASLAELFGEHTDLHHHAH